MRSGLPDGDMSAGPDQPEPPATEPVRNAMGSKVDTDKLQLDFILGDFPRALAAICEVGQHGNATKYQPHSFLFVDDGVQRYANAAFRHWVNSKRGAVTDPDSGLASLAHETWNKLAQLELMLRAKELAEQA